MGNPFLLGGMFLFATSFVLWLFVLALVASFYFFDEKLCALLIILGVLALSKA